MNAAAIFSKSQWRLWHKESLVISRFCRKPEPCVHYDFALEGCMYCADKRVRRPCKPGYACTVKKTDGKIDRSRDMRFMPDNQRQREPPKKDSAKAKYNEMIYQQRMELYKQGLCDAEIAAQLGLTRCAISHWRDKYELPPHPSPKKNDPALLKSLELRMKLYQQGLNDVDIAERVGLTVSTIQKWRNRKNLPPNASKGGCHKKDKEENHE